MTDKIRLDTLAKRLRYAMDLKGISKSIDLSKGAKVTPAVISNLLRGRRDHTKHIFSIADFLGVSARWLIDGRERFALTVTNRYVEGSVDFDREHPLVATWAPVFTWQEAGKNVFTARDVANDETRLRKRRHEKASVDSFIMIMAGKSMQSDQSSEFSFYPNDVLHFEPANLKNIKDGQYVIAREHNSDTAIFRQLINDCGERVLYASNKHFPVIKITTKVKIFAVLISRSTDFEE